MIFSGLQKTSLIDFPGRISAILFTRGCTFRCVYCHNPELVDPKQYYPEIPETEIIKFLDKRREILDGVVITGGEPTIFSDLPAFIKRIKAMGFAVKLDTNGTNFKMLKQLVEAKAVDYVAMDIKHHLARYAEITGVDVPDVYRSLKYLLTEPVDYEFRTTLLPKYFSIADFHQIGKLIKGAKRYYLQQFRPERTLDPALAAAAIFTEGELNQFQKLLSHYVAHCAVRGII